MAVQRWCKYQALKLLRTSGGAAQVAKGFCVGLFIEMFTLPTAGLAFLLLFPLVYMLRGRVAAAFIGFVLGKVIYIPVAVLNERVGHWLLPSHWTVSFSVLPEWLNHVLTINMYLIVGGIIDGALLGFMLYFPVKQGLLFMQERRRQKRRWRRVEADR
ncbi:DUF2062 domain-containing protein [Paenibacillus apiarius]|uniref:DUF2062 domain-containing protein n=1 Tax=Paenibacillus apiarius TaxID=46240 RepID=A0ABT4DRI0_9BACL|nr:DUF2062 domain-containing protein [Paenibacillus apiarius]MCY9516651.1 DUF2062 domain-containing protein [Paenibacillus apiarius]MCY9519951.1 DUF2062 domain-containing protein [Paenibacillus apiarius]MCY9553811.1 DUF2062 domain-containing protein [Paenibacillus apiarius]MCY9557581.1 DUF2062 domain-containing protein [Paenibacillus apiarius]MCY9685541.1 DUF2062 domain-containing protein [Paenibacillus apiarius]